ncbi:MAG: hypothetical protein ACP5HS_02945 [Anaerolineae bacterium]
MSVFDLEFFANPPNRFRPLQIVHGLDHLLARPGESRPDEDDPAGQWADRLAASPLLRAGALRDDFPGKEGIDAYLTRLVDLGIGGIVTNVGFHDYLVSPQQWAVLRYGQRRAMDLGLRVWLYDEKGYPSGTAGGIVTRANPEHSALGLACYVNKVEGGDKLAFPLPPSCRAYVDAVALQEPERATRDGVLDLSAQVDQWDTLRWSAPEGNWTVLYFAERIMYEGTHAQGNVSEAKHYVNLLEPEAVRDFLRVTHEAYYRELAPDLWDGVEAIFTDEPSLMTFYVPALPERYWGKVPIADRPLFQDRPPAVAWTRDFLESFRQVKNYDLRPHLFALFFSQSEEACYVRQDYYEVLTQRYTDAFYSQVQDWCRAHGIAASGHVLLEENILDHVPFHGSLFSVVRKMDVPGIDMLNSDPVEMLHGGSFMGASFMAIKQVTSVAHLTGREVVHSESSDWEQRNAGKHASLAERMGQANLQYVLGVNQITSYFGWHEFSEAEQRRYHDYVGRLGTLLTGGRHVCDVAVLYPIRTLWSHYLPPLAPIPSWTTRTTRSEWEARLAEAYPALVQRLLCNQIDLDIVDEEALVTGDILDGALHVGREAYRVLVLPPLDTLSLATVEALIDFTEAGGHVLAVGTLPRLAESVDRTPELQRRVGRLFGADAGAEQVALEDIVEAVRARVPPDLQIRTGPEGMGITAEQSSDILYTHRYLEGRHVYFVINNAPEEIVLGVELREAGPYVLYRPLDGSRRSLGQAPLVALGPFEGAFIVCEREA